MLGVLAPFLAGCDTMTPEPITLPVKTVEFRFAFHADTVGTGAFVVPAREAADLEGALEGFAKDEILSARVVGIEVERIEPPLARLGDLAERLTVRLTAPGASPRLVGESGQLPASSRVTFAPASADVGALLRAASFGAELSVDPRTLASDRYLLSARLNLEIVVEGL